MTRSQRLFTVTTDIASKDTEIMINATVAHSRVRADTNGASSVGEPIGLGRRPDDRS